MTTVGFDFGTTNSLISIIQGGRCISFSDSQGLPIPSVVCYEGAHVIRGRPAKERLAQAGLGVHGNIIRSPKTLIGRENVFVNGVAKSPVDIVHDVVAYVAEQSRRSPRAAGLNIDEAVVTIPVTMEGYRRRALRDAFRMAGIRIVQFVHEPLAALYGFFRSEKDCEAELRRYAGQLLLVVDWGGGTLDITLCRLTDGMLVQVGNDGCDDAGGDVFDEIIRNEVERRFRAQRGISEAVEVSADAKIRLMHNCERAKIDLSTRTTTKIFVASYFVDIADPDLDYTLSRGELEEIVSGVLKKGFSRIDRLLERCDFPPAAISLCLAAGGMSNMPGIRRHLHELFGPERVRMPDDSGTLVSRGAAWVAHDGARLHLAKRVELLLARNTSMVLLDAGTQMPQEGEVQQTEYSLYCADPRDGFAKLQIQVPIRPGKSVLPNDERIPLSTFNVDVDKSARPLLERIHLNIAVDDNLILRAEATSLNIRARGQGDIHDLEFGIKLATDAKPEIAADEKKKSARTGRNRADGDVVLRSNVTDDTRPAAVPGELLYSFDSGYFDRRTSPPEIQVEELLYYRPCALCGRRSNDPLCHCDQSRL